MQWTYLVVSIFVAFLVANAFHPSTRTALVAPMFVAGWLTVEAPILPLVLLGLSTLAALLAGAFSSWISWLALGICFFDLAGLGSFVAGGYKADRVYSKVFEDLEAKEHLSEAEPQGQQAGRAGSPQHHVSELPIAGSDTMWRGARLLGPWALRGDSVSAVRNIDYWGDGNKRHMLDIFSRSDGVASTVGSFNVTGSHAEGDAAGGEGTGRGAPVFLYIHGGAWAFGDKRTQARPLIYELARRGWVTVTANYRLSPKSKWPDHIVDTKRAIAWVKENIAQYGGDPTFVAIGGGSAGGHLTALAALTPNDPAFQPGFEEKDTSVDACVPLYGVYDFTGSGPVARFNKTLGGLVQNHVFQKKISDAPEEFRAASPIFRVRAEAPPFFIIHGSRDNVVPPAEAKRFVEVLSGVSRSPVVYAEVPGAHHAFDNTVSLRSAHTVAAVVRFLEGVRATSAIS